LIGLLAVATAAVGCGSNSGLSPVAPTTSTGTSTQLVPPTAFRVTAQRIDATSNEVALAWTSSESSFQLTIGSSSGAADQVSTLVPTNTFTWTTPREAGTYYARVFAKRGDATSTTSSEITITVVDVRDIIEAMFFHSGRLSDAAEQGGPTATTGNWADGTHLRVLVSTEAGETSRQNAQTFADQYAALVGGAITATAEMTSDPMQSITPSSLAAFTIGVRVQSGICTAGALACANYGPTPLGTNRSIITLALSGAQNVGAIAHEMGHAYGMGHIQTPAAGRSEFRFMMNSNSGSEQMTEAEKLAVTLAWNAGLRSGMTRSDAVSRGLVNP
jgi:hypothetical protein